MTAITSENNDIKCVIGGIEASFSNKVGETTREHLPTSKKSSFL